MAKQETIRATPAKGTRDFLPKESLLRDWATDKIKETYRNFGFTVIETPALENIELLKKGEGGENLQLIFEILKRGDKLEKAISSNGSQLNLSDLGLRFDLTVPLVRYYANNVNELPTPFKSIQIGPVWRAERPQKGRYRQFTQCDIDIIGLKSSFAELDLLNATSSALVNLGLKGFTVRINDRAYLQELVKYFEFDELVWDKVFISLDKLDKIGLAGVKKELPTSNSPEKTEKFWDLLDVYCNLMNDTSCSGIEQFKKLEEAIPQEVKEAGVLTNVKELVEAIEKHNSDFKVQFDPTLVRGMGYYTGPIFEVSVEGYGFSVAGGGRYDKMIGKFLGRDVPACGFSIGFERIVTILEDQNFQVPNSNNLTALIFDEKRDSVGPVMEAFAKLRMDDLAVSLVPKRKDLKKQLDHLKSQGISKFCIFRGDPQNLEIKDLD